MQHNIQMQSDQKENKLSVQCMGVDNLWSQTVKLYFILNHTS
jgi:hypothetical protein